MQSLREATSDSRSWVKSLIQIDILNSNRINQQNTFNWTIRCVFTSFPNFFLSYKSLPSCRWHADLEMILSQIDLEIILSQIDQVQNIYCEKFAGEMAIFCKCRKYTKLQEWKTQETFQREKFHVSESIPVQQSLSPEMQISFFFSFVWYVCFSGWILAFLGFYVCFESC